MKIARDFALITFSITLATSGQLIANIIRDGGSIVYAITIPILLVAIGIMLGGIYVLDMANDRNQEERIEQLLRKVIKESRRYRQWKR